MPAIPLTNSNIKEFISSFDHVLCDCDGVLWEEDVAIEGSIEAILKLRSLGKKVILVTNNGARTRAKYVEKCSRLNLPIEKDDIVTSGSATACYIKEHLPSDKVAYVIGTTHLCTELKELGIPHFGNGPEDLLSENESQLDIVQKIDLKSNVGAVIVGTDFDFHYIKIAKAATYVQDKSCIFVSNNRDIYTMHPVWPFLGSLPFVVAVETASKRTSVNMAKPSPNILLGIKGHKIDYGRTIIIGDTAYTDILLGHNCGIRSVLVLSGMTALEEVQQWMTSLNQEEKKLVPDFYIKTLGDILCLL